MANLIIPKTSNHPVLQSKLEKVKDNNVIQASGIIASYFKFNEGIHDLMDIMQVLNGVKQYCDDDNDIFYIFDLYGSFLVLF